MNRGERKKATSPLWEKVVANITEDARYTVNLSDDIVDQINLYLKQNSWTQKDLANALGKSPSEISKWLQYGHNFTCRTIGKLSAAFGKDLVVTPLRHNSMKGQILPFGEKRSHAYVAAYKNAQEKPETFSISNAITNADFTHQGVVEQQASTSFSTIQDVPAGPIGGTPSYATAA